MSPAVAKDCPPGKITPNGPPWGGQCEWGAFEKGPLKAWVQGTVSTRAPGGHEQQGGQSRRVNHNRVRDNALQLPDPPTQIGVGGGTETRHSQHPSIQLPPHDHPKGLLRELHTVECERRLAIDTRGLQGHFIASVGRIFDLEDKNSVRGPWWLAAPNSCLLHPSPSRGGRSQFKSQGGCTEPGGVDRLVHTPEPQFPIEPGEHLLWAAR